MLHFYNIGLYPQWIMRKRIGEVNRFSLVFEGLDDSCTSFHLEEEAIEGVPFYTPEIVRNHSDIYVSEVFFDIDKYIEANFSRRKRNQ